ncbi:MAG: hypothetical protein Q9176_001954 [Flavoplaca citrina]
MPHSTEENGYKSTTNSDDDPEAVLKGWHFWLVILALCLALLLSTLETTIIATAPGFLIIFARLSDIFGRKLALLSALTLFTVFSLACGVAQTTEQLIIFRAFQGVGGSGIYSMVMAIAPEITPAAKFGLVSGCISAVFASASILGPIIGGAITSTTTWRWVFYLNIPGGALVAGLLFWEFPRHRKAEGTPGRLAQIDWPGVILSLAGSIVLVFPLEQGGVQYPWNSATIISTFVVAGVAWVAFVIWETFLTLQGHRFLMLPVFPVRLATHRVVGSALLSGFLTGFPFMVIIIFLPQRFQIENSLSPVDAGVKMLALLLLSAFGAGLAGFICSKKNISWYLLVLSNVLQVIGLGLLSTIPSSDTVLARQYGYQVILGLGFGLGLSSLVIVSRVEVDEADLAVTMGAITQVRVLGGVVGIAIAQVVVSSTIRSDLPSILNPDQVEAFLESAGSIASLEPSQAAEVRRVYGRAFNLQTRMVMYFAIASLVVCLIGFRRHPKSFADAGKKDTTVGEERVDPGASDVALVESVKLRPRPMTRPGSTIIARPQSFVHP